ncbi:MAG: ABC transporter permease [Phycisphaerales bacterium]
MWPFILRRLLASIPVYLGIILIVMAALRVSDPVNAYLGKNATQEQIQLKRRAMGLDRPFVTQYVEFLGRIATLDFGTEHRRYESWKYEGQNVGKKLAEAVGPSLSITLPEMALTTVVSITIGMISAYCRGRWIDRWLMFLVVLGMSVSVLVFIVLGQKFGSTWLKSALGLGWFAASGYEPWLAWSKQPVFGLIPYPTRFSPATWAHYCLLPVLIYVVVAIGYDTRFYRAVMVEETTKDYITTAIAKGAPKPKIMFVHMLKNAMIPIITRVMITLPFLIAGSILLEYQFRIPGMGKLIIDAIKDRDFPIIQTFTAIFACVFIISNILTDVLYALVDPRVRLS